MKKIFLILLVCAFALGRNVLFVSGVTAFDTKSVNLGTPNTTKYLKASTASSLNFTTAMTFCGWIKAATPTGTKAIIAKYNTSVSDRAYLVTNVQASPWDKMQVRLSGNGDNQSGGQFKQYTGSISVFDGNWHFVAYTWNSGTLKLYVDGTEDTGVVKDFDGSFSSIHTNSIALYTGAQFTAPSTVGAKFAGLLDEYSLWSVALSGAEISQVYNSGTPNDLSAHAQYANLVSWWRYGEGSDGPTTVFDVKGSNNLTGTSLVSGDFTADVP